MNSSLNILSSPKRIIKNNFSIILELILIAMILIVFNSTIIKPFNGVSHLENTHQFLRFIWLSSPLITLFFGLRLLRCRAILTFYIILIITLTLYYINTTKIALTGEPISYNDIFSGVNINLAVKYLSFKEIIKSIITIALGLAIFFIERRFIKAKKDFLSILSLFILTMPLALSPYFPVIFGEKSSLTQKIYFWGDKYDVVYFSWDWAYNMKVHGLPMHLVQTSVRRSLPSASPENRAEFSKNNQKNTTVTSKQGTIIYILCESCWYDNNNFTESFTPLLDAGYKTFRAMSPVYGGGTANAEFEMLTGLPSNSGVLSGIIYQEYSSLIKNGATTLPSMLHKKGYLSIGVHNYLRSFWRRDIVYKKFGFDKFISLEDMGDLPQEYSVHKQPWQNAPDDFLLYRAVLNEINNKKDKSLFFHLITMSSHGPFLHENDSGERNYKIKIKETVDRLTEFTQNLSRLDPNAIIIVYGDHKPGLNKYFYEHHVLPSTLFNKTGKEDADFLFKVTITPKDYGDVPVFIKGGDDKTINKLISEANGKPFFCLSAIVDKYFIHSDVFAFNYNLQHGCLSTKPYDYHEMTTITPPWVYSLSLFK